MVSGPVGVAVIITAYSVSAARCFGNFGKTILHVSAESRLTVVVGVMIGVVIGLTASSGRGVVSAAIVIALPNVLARVS